MLATALSRSQEDLGSTVDLILASQVGPKGETPISSFLGSLLDLSDLIIPNRV